MKTKIYALFVLTQALFLIPKANAQIKNVTNNNDSTIILDAVYAGILNSNSFTVDSIHASSSATFRVGVVATWKLSNNVLVNTSSVVETSPSNVVVISQFHLRINPISRLKIYIGNLPTLSTEQRPVPASSSGQFETTTEARIPGTAPGIKVKYSATNTITLGLGLAARNNEPEYHANIALGSITLSGYYNKSTREYASAFTYSDTHIYTTTVWKEREVLANVFCYTFYDKKLSVYSDTGYDLSRKQLLRGEWGLLRNFSVPHSAGLIGLGYAYEKRTVVAYLFIHL
jgi:hypothetical protein